MPIPQNRKDSDSGSLTRFVQVLAQPILKGRQGDAGGEVEADGGHADFVDDVGELRLALLATWSAASEFY